MVKKSSQLFSFIVITFIMMIWGLNIVLIKLIVEEFSPIMITSLRIFTAGTVVLIIVLFLKDFRKLTKEEWKFTIIAAITGVIGHQYFLAEGLTMTTASNASLILALIPLTTSILATIMLKDRLTKLRVFGILLGIFGVAMITLNGNGEVSSVDKGDLFLFLAMILQAYSFIYIKRATNTLSSKQMTAIMLIIGSFSLFIISLFTEPDGFVSVTEPNGLTIWGVFLLSAVGATAVGHLIFNSAIQRLGAGQTAIFNNFVPFFGLISSVLILGETITIIQLGCFIFIVLGVLFGTGYVDEQLVKRRELRKQNRSAS